MKITGVNVRISDTGMAEVNAYVDGQKNPYVMNVIATGYDTSWPDYTLTTSFGLALTRTSRWDIESKVEPQYKNLAIVMYDTAYHLFEANKPEPVKKEEDVE